MHFILYYRINVGRAVLLENVKKNKVLKMVLLIISRLFCLILI